jgi:hypothetical protein
VKKWDGPGTSTCHDVGNPNLSIWGGLGCAKTCRAMIVLSFRIRWGERINGFV